MYDGVYLADIGEELVTESFAFGGAFDETGYIYDAYLGGDDAIGLYECCQFVEPFIGYVDEAGIGFDRAKAIVAGLCFGAVVG